MPGNIEIMTNATITNLYRYPVKGLSPDRLETTAITAGEGFAFDRAFAIENGTHDFDPINPRYFPKAKFLQLMSNEQLAALETCFDPETTTLKVLRNGKQVAAGNLSLPIGRQLLEQFFAAYLGSAVRGTPRIVTADNHHFADVPDNFVSLINLASVRDLERISGKPVDPLRFRGNIYVEGWEPWQEMSLAGHTLNLSGGTVFKVIEPVTRCAAINVDPQTGSRDMSLPRLLSDVFGHECCGLYLSAIRGGTLSNAEIIEIGTATSADRDLGI
jgi:uncharacterized protein YcbX